MKFRHQTGRPYISSIATRCIGSPHVYYAGPDARTRPGTPCRRPAIADRSSGPGALAARPALATVTVGLWAAVAQVATLVLVFAVMFALESRRSKQA